MFHMNFESLLTTPMLVFLTNMAIISALVCGAALLVDRLTQNVPLPLRHTILLTALMMALISPLIIGVVEFGDFSPIRVISSPSPGANRLKHDQVADVTPVLKPVNLSVRLEPHQTERKNQVVETSATREFQPTPRQHGPSIDGQDHVVRNANSTTSRPIALSDAVVVTANGLILLWGAGTLFCVFQFVRGIVHLHKFLKTLQPLDNHHIIQIAQSASAGLGMRYLPTLWQSSAAQTPLSCGFLRPSVIVPSVEQLRWTDEQWKSLLLHEMAHVKRRDHLVGAVQRLACIVFWWNPCVRAVSARIAELRELLCDDLVTKHGSDSKSYAAVLVEMADQVIRQCNVSTALSALGGSKGTLTDRVHRLLDTNRSVITNLDLRMMAVGASCALGMLILASIAVVHTKQVSAVPPGND